MEEQPARGAHKCERKANWRLLGEPGARGAAQQVGCGQQINCCWGAGSTKPASLVRVGHQLAIDGGALGHGGNAAGTQVSANVAVA